MHGKHGEAPSPSDFEIASLAGFERATLFFQPTLELGARHLLRYNTSVLFATDVFRKMCFGSYVMPGSVQNSAPAHKEEMLTIKRAEHLIGYEIRKLPPEQQLVTFGALHDD